MKKKCFAIILSALLLSFFAVNAFADPPAAPPGGFGESGGPGGPGGAPGSSASVAWTGATTITSAAEQSGQT